MNSGIVLEFHASHLAVVVLLGLGGILVGWRRARSSLALCYLALLGPHPTAKGSCVRITTLGQPSASRVYNGAE